MLAQKLNVQFLDFDSISEQIDNFDLSKDIPRVIDEGIKRLDELLKDNRLVVAAFPVRQEDYERLAKSLGSDLRVVTLSPPLEVTQTNRGTRELTAWEKQRIKYHYDTKISNPGFGLVIDNSKTTPDQTADSIIRKLGLR